MKVAASPGKRQDRQFNVTVNRPSLHTVGKVFKTKLSGETIQKIVSTLAPLYIVGTLCFSFIESFQTREHIPT